MYVKDQRVFFFENGYGASVVEISGNWSHTLELAVIRGNAIEWDFDFTTPIASDILRISLSDNPKTQEERVQQILRKIWRLPSCKKEDTASADP